MRDDPAEPTPAVDRPRAARSKRFLITLLKACVSVALLAFVLRDTGWSDIFASARAVTVPLVLLIFAMQLTNSALSTVRWRGLLRARGTDASFRYLFSSYLIGMFFSNFLPSTIGGDASRAYDTWRLGQSKAGSVAVVFLDRFIGLLGLLLFAAIGLLVPGTVRDQVPLLRFAPLLIGIGVLIASVVLFFPQLIRRIVVLLGELPGAARFRRIVEVFEPYRNQPRVLGRAFGLSVIQQANVVLMYYVLARGLDFPIAWYNFLLIVPIAIMLMMLPISVNAIGIRESVFAIFFAPFGVSTAAALAFAWISYGIPLLQVAIGGVLYVLRDGGQRSVDAAALETRS